MTTPAGTPASANSGISANIVSGVSKAGLMITEHPAASAGAISGSPSPPDSSTGLPAQRPPLASDGRGCARRTKAHASVNFRPPARPLPKTIGRTQRHRPPRPSPVRTRLAIFEGDETREIFEPGRHKIEGLAQDFPAGRARARPTSPGRRSQRRSPRSHPQPCPTPPRAEHGFIGRVEHVETDTTRTGTPLAVDVEFVREHADFQIGQRRRCSRTTRPAKRLPSTYSVPPIRQAWRNSLSAVAWISPLPFLPADDPHLVVRGGIARPTEAVAVSFQPLSWQRPRLGPGHESPRFLAKCANIWMPKPPSRSLAIRCFQGRRMICVVSRRVMSGAGS